MGLVADPASPTKIARRMGDLDPPGGEDRDAWDIEVVSEPFTTGSEDVDTALGRLGDEAREHEWDLVVGLTELPLRDDDGRYLLIQADPQGQRAVLSLPALGGLRMHARTRHAVRTLVGGMADPSSQDEHRVPTPPPQWPLAAAPGHGARQPSVAPRARTQVRARRRPGNRRRRHHQLHGLATGRLPVVVASRGRDDRLRRARRRLDRDRWRTVGPPRRQLHRGSGEVPSLQHLDAADPDRRGPHLLPRALRREPGLGAVRPRPRRDGRLPARVARLRRPVRAGLVRRVGGDRRRRPRHRPGIGRSDPRGRVLKARGGTPRPTRTRTELIENRSTVRPDAGCHHLRPALTRNSYTRRTAIAPSPTADATRFTEPLRTSPTAKTPALAVSNMAASSRPAPVSTNPLSSSAIAPSSHWVWGSDPISTKRAVALRGRRSSVRRSWTMTSSRPRSPTSSQTSQLRQTLHPWGRRDPLCEVAGHVPVQVVVADHEVDVSGVPSQEQGGLPGGVPATDDRDRVAAAEPCLELGGGVVDAGALEPVHAGDVQAAVAHAGREHHGVRLHLGPVGQSHDEVAVDAVERLGLAGDREGGAELAGLDHRAVGQLAARDARREAEVVLDLGRGPRLPSRRDRVEHDRGESFGGRGHRSGETGRAGADHQQVVRIAGRRVLPQAEELGQLGVAGVAQDRLAPSRSRRGSGRVGCRTPAG